MGEFILFEESLKTGIELATRFVSLLLVCAFLAIIATYLTVDFMVKNNMTHDAPEKSPKI